MTPARTADTLQLAGRWLCHCWPSLSAASGPVPVHIKLNQPHQLLWPPHTHKCSLELLLLVVAAASVPLAALTNASVSGWLANDLIQEEGELGAAGGLGPAPRATLQATPGAG